ncbi:nucleotidyltransferase family protein [Labrys okinawensis]|uniref:nucleotidyltransferase family protein n=1 Tax=Labrys okinawensis TaxID=346911 RepID=UPI0039BCC398
MLLAAGLGKRMRPLTDHKPKPLVEVAGKTLIDHVLDRLAFSNVETAVVNVHYFAEQMEAHLAGRQHPKILISDERAGLLDSGGGVRKALPLLGEAPFIVCNCDSFWIEGPQVNLDALKAHWDPARMDILMLVAATATSVGFDGRGDYQLDSHGALARRRECETALFAYAGVLLIKPELFKGTPEIFSLNRLFDEAEARGRLFGKRLDGIWLHVGTPQAVVEAERKIALSPVE